MTGISQRQMVMVIEWRETQNTSKMEDLIRELAMSGHIPKITRLLLMVDHKNFANYKRKDTLISTQLGIGQYPTQVK